MTVRKFGRRAFLVGAGGTLAIPFLSSLFPEEASAQTQTVRRFVSLHTPHGALWPGFAFPVGASDQTTLPGSGGWAVRHGRLQAATIDGVPQMTPTHRAAALDEGIVGKMNLLQGIDFPIYPGHNYGMMLGTHGSNVELPEGGSYSGPTIDQVLARSNAVYPWSPSRRSVHVGAYGEAFSIRYSGGVGTTLVRSPATTRPSDLFDELFGGVATGEVAPDVPQVDQSLLIDRVGDAYRDLASGAHGLGRRISTEDRRRLEQHAEAIFELESAANAITRECYPPDAPGDHGWAPLAASNDSPLGLAGAWQLTVNMIAAAFACDITRVVTLDPIGTGWYPEFGSTELDWHQEVFHVASQEPDGVGAFTNTIPEIESAAGAIREVQQRQFENIFLPLVQAMNSLTDPDGTNVLDESLVLWGQEAGISTHNYVSVPILMAGGLGGHFQTGNFVDYRNLDHIAYDQWGGTSMNPGTTSAWHQGLLIDQLLGNILRGFGVDPASEPTNSSRGFGSYPEAVTGTITELYHAQEIHDRAGDELTILQS